LLSLVFLSGMLAGQKTDTTMYVPQISLTADQGFGPYLVGTESVNTFTISELPKNTSNVMFRFIDVDGNQVGEPFNKTGASLTSVSWQVNLGTIALPLSPQFHARVTYQTDSIADYYVAYTVYPDTISFEASKGWGPFTTNNYSFSNNTWLPVPELKNSFSVSNLPPRTEKVFFKIVTTDSLTVDSLVVTPQPGQYLDLAVFQNVRMDNLPLSTHYLKVVIFCNGCPDHGLGFQKLIQVVQHKPKLTTHSEGSTHTDTILPCIKAPSYGQALMVDSVRHAEISNGPGGFIGSHRGPYSFDVIKDEFAIESWLRFNLIHSAVGDEEVFISVDSAYVISIQHGQNALSIVLSAVIYDPEINIYEIYKASFNVSLLQEKEWHHFAFSCNPVGGSGITFYLDGQPLSTTVNQNNINIITQQHSNYADFLKTVPLCLGGLGPNAPNIISAFDEFRIWVRSLTHSEVYSNMNRHIIQTPDLIGYWDFDDMRNRLNFISDDGILNNAGTLKNGAAFITEYPGIFATLDTLIVNLSNAATDSVLMAFIDEDSYVVDSVIIQVADHQVQWIYDLAALPYNTSHLRVIEFDPLNPEGGFESLYNIKVHAQAPIATSQYNWGLVYQSDNNFGNLTYPITVNGFPDNTTSVELGLTDGTNNYNVETYSINSIPYQYSLTFNGTNNYFNSNTQTYKPNFDISLWFNTTSTTAGVILCDYDVTNHSQDLVLTANADGSVSFSMLTFPGAFTLHAANRYNDGLWHQVRVIVINMHTCKLYMDGCLVDQKTMNPITIFRGSWVVGRDEKNGNKYFKGSLAQLNLKSSVSSAKTGIRSIVPDETSQLLYKLDEGLGTIIHESMSGGIIPLHGSNQFWNKSNKLSCVSWQHNMIDKPVGWYTFYAKVYYAGGGEEFVYYPLGKFWLKEPFPDYTFSYNFTEGLGYFNEGVALSNTMVFKTNYTGQGQPFWMFNVLNLKLIAPDGEVIDEGHKVWLNNNAHDSVAMDVGDAPPGSYFQVAIGYEVANPPSIEYFNEFSIPLLIRPMLAPVLAGDFGPFEQAIAPGTMEHENTFIVKTDGLTDITKVIANFYDPSGKLVAAANGVKTNDSNWAITQNMAVLSPPLSTMNISYYLGAHQFLALVAGPYNITIHKTRPDWFDFIPDSDFSDIHENGDEVTFEINTPFEQAALFNFVLNFSVPDNLPLIGGSESKLNMPGVNVKLKYTKSTSRLALNAPPDFYQEQFSLGSGDSEILSFNFDNSPYNTYELDERNNLIASQNFSLVGDITGAFDTFEKIGSTVEQIKELVELIEDSDPESVIVKPTFELSYSGSFQYSSRLRFKIDSITGKWGSYGNLNVDANPDHEEAFKNSSSYHFYAGSLGMEFSVGMEVFEGLVSGNFGIDGEISLGFGQSYVTIPSYRDKFLKALSFESYARFYVDVFWGWYEKTLWGPQMIFTANLWDDNMDNAFPSSKTIGTNLKWFSDGTLNKEFVRNFGPVSTYSRMPLPKPQSSLALTPDALIFSWLEKGDDYGERNLRTCQFNFSTNKFTANRTIESNSHALNSPVSGKEQDGISIYTWSQSRHTSETFGAIPHESNIEEFVRSQDIHFSVYNSESGNVMQTGILDDLQQTNNDGRAEGSPQVIILSASRALLTWQVVDPEIPQADIWYAFLDDNNGQWIPTIQGVAVSGEGVESKVELVPAGEGKALLAWMNTSRDELPKSTIMASYFDGIDWRVPEQVSNPGDTLCNYFDVNINSDLGALVYTMFIEDTVNGYYEKVKLIPWSEDHFEQDSSIELYVDSVAHVQLPSIALDQNGRAAVAVKTERLFKKEAGQKISEVDIFTGNLNFPYSPWNHIAANPFVCDTTKQVAELNIGFLGNDTILMLSQEFPLSATNTPFIPENGIKFGHPYMNLVLRGFMINEEGEVKDVDELIYFVGIEEPEQLPETIKLFQCYPNPCVDHTTIHFGIIQASTVKIDLLNVHGNLHSSLVNQTIGAGTYELDMNTSSLSPGAYIVRLQTSDSMQTIKLVVSD